MKDVISTSLGLVIASLLPGLSAGRPYEEKGQWAIKSDD